MSVRNASCQLNHLRVGEGVCNLESRIIDTPTICKKKKKKSIIY